MKAYIAEGLEDEKLQFLKERAILDYLIAEPFEIPERCNITIMDGLSTKSMPVTHIDMLQILDSPIDLFEDVIKADSSWDRAIQTRRQQCASRGLGKA